VDKDSMLKRTALVFAVLLSLSACGNTSGTSTGTDAAKTNESVPSGAIASAEANAGIPSKPDAATTAAYIGALKAIDPDIVHGKDDRAVSHGRDQCGSVHSSPNDQAKLVDLANQRFTSPNHPNGFGKDKATRILEVVRKYLCP
jgi:hypothetical protein